jgi:hypothetical protein
MEKFYLRWQPFKAFFEKFQHIFGEIFAMVGIMAQFGYFVNREVKKKVFRE